MNLAVDKYKQGILKTIHMAMHPAKLVLQTENISDNVY